MSEKELDVLPPGRKDAVGTLLPLIVTRPDLLPAKLDLSRMQVTELRFNKPNGGPAPHTAAQFRDTHGLVPIPQVRVADERGRVRMLLPLGHSTLISALHEEGWRYGELRWKTKQSSDDAVAVTVPLLPLRGIEGTLVDANGLPISNAPIEIQRFRSPGKWGTPRATLDQGEAHELLNWSFGEMAAWMSGTDRVVWSNAKGQFQMTLPFYNRDYRLSATTLNNGAALSGSLDLPRARENERVRLVMYRRKY